MAKKPVALAGVAGVGSGFSTAYRFTLQAKKKEVIVVILKGDQKHAGGQKARAGGRQGVRAFGRIEDKTEDNQKTLRSQQLYE